MAHAVGPLLRQKGSSLHAPASGVLQRQLQLAVQFGALAASASNLQLLQDEMCRVAANGLRAPFVRLLIYRAHERKFVTEACIGWQNSIVVQLD